MSEESRKAWAFDPCQPTTYPTDRARTATRTASAIGPEWGIVLQLSVYTGEAAATEAMAGFRRVLSACSEHGPDSYGQTTTWRSTPVDLADDALLAWQRYTKDGQPIPAGAHVMIVRDGRSIFLGMTHNETVPSGPRDSEAKYLDARAREILPLPG